MAVSGGDWRQKLGELAPMPVQIAGPQAIQFFVADGNTASRFSLWKNLRDGNLSVYLTTSWPTRLPLRS